ncbi:hypothetical protein EAF04_004919 [Stromatinia cepivora]|nr:hypothetical protein EAF04_004919 [Stromatinia cepivora]
MARTKVARGLKGRFGPRKPLVSRTCSCRNAWRRSPPKQTVKYSRLPTANCYQCQISQKKAIPSPYSESIISPTTFHQFPLLPLEIQTKIWKLAAYSTANESRIIPILVHWKPGCLSNRYKEWEHRTPISLTPISVIPPLLHTCSISRLLALSAYELVGIHDSSLYPRVGSDLDSPPNISFEPGDKGTGIYVNPKRDMIYFTGHDVFDKRGNQHFPISDTHTGEEGYSFENTKPEFCRACSDLTFPVGNALRLVIGDPRIRKELRNLGFGFDVPGLKRQSFERERLENDFIGLRRIVFGSEERQKERKALRNGKAHGKMLDSANSNSLILIFTTPSAHIRNKCFQTYLKRFHDRASDIQSGSEYMTIDSREQFFRPLINRPMGPHRTRPGTSRSWLQWRKEGLIPEGWKGSLPGEKSEEEWGDDRMGEWNAEYLGPRVEFLVVGGGN